LEYYNGEVRYREWIYDLYSVIRECCYILINLSRKIHDSTIKLSHVWELVVPGFNTITGIFIMNINDFIDGRVGRFIQDNGIRVSFKLILGKTNTVEEYE
jgi:hypothetical protein